ncbi:MULTISPECIES: NADH-quinone oxidoreductase subunit NuoB [Burkholderiaceae]|jgi:formate hydrogenlyase subunit 7|uniref:NADH-quinone oxidoreductase subunit NuoB n=1 Tax=Burkholderia vietnamiensis TaxID=60552 RepID=A0AAW7TBK5_BURVI|nr:MULTISPECIES: NADH-quinone oxidoreductase subunit NuoB [Burkholderiaceae]MDN7799418.1 NADH-quinone oxidoreductase subunit NuoB [Burkholderia vietnamiensis]RFU44274.1 NADH-quinone oxidoreductase subunit NuoB [Paraburkholderia sp. DHOC27]
MSLWTWFGLHSGNASTEWPLKGEEHGQENLLGMPRYDPASCRPGCGACAEVCITHAISFAVRPAAAGEGAGDVTTDAGRDVSDIPQAPAAPDVDWGRCIVCQRCTEVCPTGAFMPSDDWAVGVARREDLHWVAPRAQLPEPRADAQDRRPFHRSLHVRHVDAGSCNGCESELQALNNPFYNLHRLGIFFTASPRFADVLLVTGPVTQAMKGPLLEAWQAMPEPKWVIATGTCAVSGGVSGGNYACGNGLDEVLPVDIYLPGCPPNPAAIIHALLMVLHRAQQRMKGGRLER